MDSLIESLKNDKSIDVKRNCAASLVKIGKDTVNPLIALLKDKHWYVRYFAAGALGEIKDNRAIIPLIERLNDDSNVRDAATESLFALKEPALELLKTILENDSAIKKMNKPPKKIILDTIDVIESKGNIFINNEIKNTNDSGAILNDLQLLIKIEKNIYSLNETTDKIKIELRVKNLNPKKEPILINKKFCHGYVQIYLKDSNGKNLKWIPELHGFATNPGSGSTLLSSFGFIDYGDSFGREFYDIATPKSITPMGYCYLITKPGKYYISADFENKEWCEKRHKNTGQIYKAWTGKLKSKTIEIEIIP